MTDKEAAYEAAARFVETWAYLAESLPHDYGCTLTCREAEAMADLFRAFGRPEVAESLMESHAETDEYGDDHYEGDEPE